MTTPIQSCMVPFFILSTLLMPIPGQRMAHGQDYSTQWNGGEHTYLGDQAFASFCAQEVKRVYFCEKSKVARQDQEREYSYGQMLALTDLYLTAEVMFAEHGRENIGHANLRRIYRCFDKEGALLHEQEAVPEYEVPDCTWTVLVGSRDYARASSINYEHFAWHNMVAYVRYHGEALALALQARQMRSSGREQDSQMVLRKALFYNAFADHLLTDAFAAGHIRVPRVQVVEWAMQNLRGFATKYQGHALSMIFHDNDGRDTTGREVGLYVQNARGDQWMTYSDRFLHLNRQRDSRAVDLPMQAIMASVGELADAYELGVLPPGVYAASTYVPWSCAGNLSTRFPLVEDKQQRRQFLKRLRAGLPPPLKWIVSKNEIERSIRGIPDMLKAFDQKIQDDIEQNPELTRRLPSRYLAVRHFADDPNFCGPRGAP